jgi:GNAT superfamily N-acetyltransferase
VFVAVERNRIVGFADIGAADCGSRPGYAQLYAIYLDPAYIGRGVGRALFQACIAHAKQRGFSSMKTMVLSKNSTARAFYERMQGQSLPETETTIETGGTNERIITYEWQVLIT